MDDNATATPAEPVDNTPADNTPTAPALDPVVAKEVDAFAGDVQGKLEVNGQEPEVQDEESVEDDTEASEDNEGEQTDDDTTSEETEESEDDQPAPQLKQEADPAGIYNQPTVEDPGDFAPQDYSFEVTIGTQTFNVKSLDDAGAIQDFIDKNPEEVSAKQLIEFMDKRSDMRTGIAQDKAKWEEKKDKFTIQEENKKVLGEQLVTWEKEFSYLTKSGSIPDIEAEYVNADWNDPEVAKQPGVKERLEIMRWMDKENGIRDKAGLPPMTSFVDAYNAMQLDTMRKGKAKDDTKDKEKRRAKGAMVGSNAPYSQTNVTKGEIVGEGGSINDLY